MWTIPECKKMAVTSVHGLIRTNLLSKINKSVKLGSCWSRKIIKIIKHNHNADQMLYFIKISKNYYHLFNLLLFKRFIKRY